jgi:hypothetical protein
VKYLLKRIFKREDSWQLTYPWTPDEVAKGYKTIFDPKNIPSEMDKP